MALEETIGALVSHHGVYVIVRTLPTNHKGVVHSWRSSTQNCAFLADVGQVVVAGHVVPFAVLMGDHNHTVLSAREEIIRLVLSPVLILQVHIIGPLEVIFNHSVIQTNPCVLMTHTINEVLLLCGMDAGQVAAVFSAVFLCIFPGVPACKISVAVTVKLPPAVLATLCVDK